MAADSTEFRETVTIIRRWFLRRKRENDAAFAQPSARDGCLISLSEGREWNRRARCTIDVPGFRAHGRIDKRHARLGSDRRVPVHHARLVRQDGVEPEPIHGNVLSGYTISRIV